MVINRQKDIDKTPAKQGAEAHQNSDSSDTEVIRSAWDP